MRPRRTYGADASSRTVCNAGNHAGVGSWVRVILFTLLPFAAPAQQSSPDTLISRLTDHVLQGVARLPDCTCLETLRRSHRAATPRAELLPLDTVRLEILYSNRKELFASPGDGHWESNPAAFPAAGIIGNGPFALYLRAIFATGDAIFTNRGEEDLEGHRSLRYDYRVPQFISGHTLTTPHGKGTIGMKGSLWFDPDSLDLRRMEMHGDEMPADLAVSDFTVTINYSLVRIGSDSALLPQSGEMRLLEQSGVEDRAAIDFTHCRSFRTESSVSFDPPPSDVANPAPPSFSSTVSGRSNVEGTLPAGLDITVSLLTPITERSLVGSAIEGRVTRDIRLRGQLLIPRNAQVHGRIRRMDRFTDRSGEYMVVALEFIEVETRGAILRFFADLADVQPLRGFEWQKTTHAAFNIYTQDGRHIVTTQQSRLPDLPGIGAFFVRGRSFTLPAGVDLFWKTISVVK